MANLSAIIAPTNVVTETSTQTLSNKTLVAPALGTPASGNLSNCTGIPAGSAATPTALGTVYGKQTTSGGTPFLTAYGYNAGVATTGVENTAIGLSALLTNITGTQNTAVGNRALRLTTGSYNTAVGSYAMDANTTGINNTAMGAPINNNFASLMNNTTGSANTAYGVGSLGKNTTASNNTAVGSQALLNNTTGASNTSLGNEALASNTTTSNNTAVGYQALYSNTAANNTAVGYQVLDSATTANYNVAVGCYYPSVGQSTLGSATTGGFNTAIGAGAGCNITTGGNNIAIGLVAGNDISTTDATISIGYACSVTNGHTHAIVIGGSIASKGVSTGFISPNGGGVYQGNNSSSWSTTSDRRLKKNIVNNEVGLEKLTQIQVRNFEYRVAEEVTELPQDQAIRKTGVQLGVIAQELQAVLPDCVKTESTGVMSVDSDNLTWYMINAIKELKAEVDSLKSQLQGN